jgi:hypothetical protein
MVASCSSAAWYTCLKSSAEACALAVMADAVMAIATMTFKSLGLQK